MSTNFPNSPTNGQIFNDPVSGNRYVYDSTKGFWRTSSNVTVFIANAAYTQSNLAFNQSNTAFDKANAANVLAYNTGIGANAYADLVGTSANNYAGSMSNTVLSYVSSNYATQTTVATNATSANNYAGAMANSANAYAASLTPDLSPVFIVANTAFDKANAANVLAYNTGIGANNYAGTMANAANSYATATYATQTTVATNATSANNYAGSLANAKVDTITSNSTSRLWANSVTVSGIETVYLDLASSGVSPTTYGGSTNIPALTVDTYGRVTSASNVAVSAGGLTVNNEIASASVYYPLFTTTSTGSASIANVATSKLTFVPSTGTLFANVLSILKYTETISSSTGSTSLNLDNGSVFKVTTSGATTITLPASSTGKSFIVIVSYAGADSITWAGGTTIKWSGGSAPTLTSVSGKFDIFAFFQDGTNTYGTTYGFNF